MGMLYCEVRISYILFALYKGRPPGQHLIEHTTHAVDIASVIEAFWLGDLFRAHVRRCSNDLTRAGSTFLADRKSNAKINQHSVVILVQQHVGWLDIAVYNPFLVGV